MTYIKSALHRNDINVGHGSAVFLQLMGVGTRQCRVLGIIPMQPETILWTVTKTRFLTSI